MKCEIFLQTKWVANLQYVCLMSEWVTNLLWWSEMSKITPNVYVWQLAGPRGGETSPKSTNRHSHFSSFRGVFDQQYLHSEILKKVGVFTSLPLEVVVESIWLLHKHWFLIEERGFGVGKDGSHIVFSMRQKAAQQLTYKYHVIIRLKSRKIYYNELEQWKWLPQVLIIIGYIPSFVALRNHHYCHPIPPHTPICTVSAVVLWWRDILAFYVVILGDFCKWKGMVKSSGESSGMVN